MSNARDKANIPALNFSSTGIDDNATSTAITINSSQQVGIGTASPTSKLQVEGSTTINSTGTPPLTIHHTDGNIVALGFQCNASDNHSLMFTDTDFRINYDGSEKMRITSSGNVGIGTSSPGTIPLNVVTTDGGNVDEILELRNNATTVGTGVRLRLVSSTDVGSLPNSVSISSYRNAGSDIDLLFETSSTERMRIDSSGNVGIGTTSPIAPLTVASGSGSGAIMIGGNASSTGISDNTRKLGRLVTPSYDIDEEPVALILADFNGSDNQIAIGGGSSALNSATKLVFLTAANPTTVNGSERMRIDSSGSLYLNTTTRRNNGMQSIDYDGNAAGGMGINDTASANASAFIAFLSGGTFRGSITNNNNTAVAYNTTSDYRLKENVSYDFDATTRLKQLRPARFNFISNADTTVDGFLAHEVQSVVPEAITGEKDAMKTEEYEVTPAVLDDDGNVITEAVMGTREVPEYQGIDQAKLVPLLVKTIQELEARITALETQP